MKDYFGRRWINQKALPGRAMEYLNLDSGLELYITGNRDCVPNVIRGHLNTFNLSQTKGAGLCLMHIVKIQRRGHDPVDITYSRLLAV